MKNSFFIFCLFLSIFLQAEIDAGVNANTYYESGESYVDLSLHIVSSTLNQKEVGSGLLQAETEITIQILNDKQENVFLDIYRLISPKTEFVQDFIDLRRIRLEPGTYSCEVTMIDVLDIENLYSYKMDIVVEPFEEKLIISNKKLLASITPGEDEQNPFFKYGYIMEPAAFSYFHKNMDNLFIYFEVYNADTAIQEDFATHLIIQDLSLKPVVLLDKFKRYTPESKNVMIEGIDITSIPSGNYNLIIELVNREQIAFHSDTLFFQRSNPKKDVEILIETGDGPSGSFVEKLSDEELIYAMKALSPRLNSTDQGFLTDMIAEDNLKGLRYFLFEYWTKFDPVNASVSFDQYMTIAKAVDKKFYSTFGHGFETDRGYIFLKYGKPDNVISVEDEPSAPPYEIWFYDKVAKTGQTNVKFLFYNPNLGAYHYELLHSTARGEKQNRKWEIELYRKAANQVDGNAVDATRMQDNFNRRARQYFQDNN